MREREREGERESDENSVLASRTRRARELLPFSN